MSAIRVQQASKNSYEETNVTIRFSVSFCILVAARHSERRQPRVASGKPGRDNWRDNTENSRICVGMVNQNKNIKTKTIKH